ncbi:PP2C family protein-serine/threonine phosphatase [Aquisphaera giovannonii]|nr:PP2C family protein-serine/threonine phosphatase [Aquisphaera giovannonii]
MEIRGGSQAVHEAFSTPGLDAWLYSRPHDGDACGGDVHYVSLCGGGVITRLVVADVSGHGAGVAGFSETLRQLMRKNINSKSQTRLVQALNREFGEAAQLSKFATAVVATYLAHRGTLTVSNAGHPRPLWYRASEGSWEILDRDALRRGNLPLGIDEDSSYGQFTIPLGRGDLVLFYTDALTEAADPAGRLLGEDGLLALARALDSSEPGTLLPSLLNSMEQHRGGRPADDDVTVLAIRHNASGPRRRTIGERLEVYGKVFGLKAY